MPTSTFRKLFSHLELSEDEMQKYSKDIISVVLVRCIQKTEQRLSPEELSILRTLRQDQNMTNIIALVKSKYTESEWTDLISQEAKVVIESYKKEVID